MNSPAARAIVRLGEHGSIAVNDTVLLERRSGVLILTLNRPDRINALTGPMHAALLDALAGAEADPACRAVLMHGAGRGFCAGQDLTETNVGGDLGEALERRYNPLVRAMRASRLPIVAAVHGVAAGAGANLALAADIVLAARSATFLEAFARIGLIPDAGGTWFLPRLVGEARARAMCLLAEPVSGEQAAAWGLVWRAVDDAALMDEAHALAARLAEGAGAALARTKRALHDSGANTLDAQLGLERDLQRECGATDDFREGVAAFVEKRPARFTGR